MHHTLQDLTLPSQPCQAAMQSDAVLHLDVHCNAPGSVNKPLGSFGQQPSVSNNAPHSAGPHHPLTSSPFFEAPTPTPATSPPPGNAVQEARSSTSAGSTQYAPEPEELAVPQVQVVQRYKHGLAHNLPDVPARLWHACCCCCAPLPAQPGQEQGQEAACGPVSEQQRQQRQYVAWAVLQGCCRTGCCGTRMGLV